MQYTPVPPREKADRPDPRVYADIDELVRLQFKAQGFSFLPRQPVHSILFGRHASRLRGRGLNFEELRRYVPGDDIRNVDWKATARAGEPNVRVFTEEKDRPMWLVVNQTQSMFFGSNERMKSVSAAEVVALGLVHWCTTIPTSFVSNHSAAAARSCDCLALSSRKIMRFTQIHRSRKGHPVVTLLIRYCANYCRLRRTTA